MVIYCIVNKISGKYYIGQTSKSLEYRWSQHCQPSSKCYGLSGAIKKYGKENFSIGIVGEYKTQEDLNNAEEYFIDYYNCLAPNGYNLTTGGEHTSLSKTSRHKSSITHKKLFIEGKTPWLPKKGESRSPETQFKKGQPSGRKGIKLSPEQVAYNKSRGSGFNKGNHPRTEFKKGKDHPGYGKPSICRKAVICLETNIIYDSMTAAAAAINSTKSVISASIKEGRSLQCGYTFQCIKVENGR